MTGAWLGAKKAGAEPGLGLDLGVPGLGWIGPGLGLKGRGLGWAGAELGLGLGA